MRTDYEPAERMKSVSYPIRDIVMEAKKAEAKMKADGKEMIWLNIGDPAQYGFEPPKIIADEVKKALDTPGLKGYAPSEGDIDLRNAVAKIEGCAPDDVFVTTGLTEGIEYFIQALIGKGEKLLLPDPTYPLYITKADVFEVKSEFYIHDADGQIDIADLRKKIIGAKAMVIINPNNPLGSLYSDKNLNEVIAVCAEHDVPVFYDGSYDKLVFDGYSDFRRLAKGRIPFIYGSSLSKVYLYPGSRVGWIAFHGDGWDKIKDAYLRLCNQRLSVNWEYQKAAAVALQNDSHLSAVKKMLLERRNALVDAAKGLPLRYPIPKGAFYAFMQLETKRWKTDKEFVGAAIKEGVVFVPGFGFGKKSQDLYFRTTFLPQPELIAEAFGRIEKLLE